MVFLKLFTKMQWKLSSSKTEFRTNGKMSFLFITKEKYCVTNSIADFILFDNVIVEVKSGEDGINSDSYIANAELSQSIWLPDWPHRKFWQIENGISKGLLCNFSCYFVCFRGKK